MPPLAYAAVNYKMTGKNRDSEPSGLRISPSKKLLMVRGRILAALLCAFIVSGGVTMLMLTTPLYMLQVFDRVMTGQHLETLVMLTLIALVAYATFGLLDWARNQMMLRAGAWAERQLTDAVLVAGLRSTISGQPLGGQGNRDLAHVRALIGGRTLFPFLDMPWALVFFVILWIMNVWMGLYAVVCAAVLALLAIAGERAMRGRQKRSDNLQVEAGQWADQAVNQAEIIQALGMRRNLLKRHREKMYEAHEGRDAAATLAGVIASTAKSVRMMAQIGILALASWLLLQGELSAGMVIGGSILMGRALAPIDIMIGSWQHLTSGWLAYGRLHELLNAHDDREPLIVPPRPEAKLILNNLYKRVPGSGGDFLLREIEFELEGGEAIGIMGPSGSGKTMLCKVLTGVMVPEIGEIRFDNARLDQWPSDALGSYLGYLPQNVGLPPATIAETIARLAPDPDMDKVFAAAEAADAHAMIMKFPQGYDTPAGSGGLPLSGGQKQRIGLARALYGSPMLIVLDEPDAHLDKEGNHALFRAIDAAKKRGAMVVIVSHGRQPLRGVDRILLLAGGSMEQMGPRDQVLASLMKKVSPDAAAASRQTAEKQETPKKSSPFQEQHHEDQRRGRPQQRPGSRPGQP